MAVLEHWLVNPYRPPKSIAATLALFGNLLNGTHGPTLFSSANFLTSKSPAPFATISKEFFGLLQIFLNYFLWPSCLDGIVPLFQRQKGCAPWTSRLTPHHMVSTHSESKCLISGEHRLTKRQLGPSYPVFDLPQLYTKPSAADILKALELLAVQPRTFNHDEKLEVQHHIHASGISQYLTSIIASALAWVDSDELREQIWEAASARLCERSGRSAMPAMSRVFTVPMTKNKDFSVTLHEPSITADNLGMKTWVSSYLLAKRLHSFLIPPSDLVPSASKNNTPLRVLELGAGTGLVGLSFAALWGSAASVHLTDLDPIVPNLAHNVTLNEELLSKTGASVTTGVLDWSLETGPLSEDESSYDLILAADPLYSPDHPRWLVQVIGRRLNPGTRSRVIVEMPLRDAYLPQVEDFKQRMQVIGLRILDQGEEIGYDDWESKDGSSLEVRCWWSVWGSAS